MIKASPGILVFQMARLRISLLLVEVEEADAAGDRDSPRAGKRNTGLELEEEVLN